MTNAPVTATPIGSPNLQPIDMFEDMDASPDEDAPLTKTKDTTLGETDVTCDTGTMDAVATNTGNTAATDARVPAVTRLNKMPSATYSALHSPSPVSFDTIDEASVPDFLLRHRKGKRVVNIFDYLKRVEDPHFQRVLFHYLHFEINDKSGMSGSLPTAKRPAEISQWSSRARPANLPDYMKGNRTFADFVDSVFTWWASIQPSWRTFGRGTVSHEVQGEWGILHSPRINGLLNIVMLVYWWVRILEEHKPKDGVRADYELFAEDVVWVFSKLSS